MKDKGTDQVCWYRKGMNSFLSDKGFVHFYAGEAMHEDFKEGSPYNFSYAEKTFGKCELVFDIEKADRISKLMVSEMREDAFWREMGNCQP
tara:strand:- start:449 stop:721 length:273 start_codon:yes stop_codon:yes gene_type:complete